jgi:D-alanine-D-alanine ligase
MPDVVFNITEAGGSRNRESLVPAVCESLGVPCTGSDAVALGLSLDKYLTKIIAEKHGAATPNYCLFVPGADRGSFEQDLEGLSFPLILKPNTGGSSMGISEASKVRTMTELFAVVEQMAAEFNDSILVEEFVPGYDITSGIIENGGPVHLPCAEIRLNGRNPDVFYSIERKAKHEREIVFPLDLNAALRERVQSVTVRIFRVLGCRGIARVDFRLGTDGVPYFLEINPLPGLSPFYSILPEQALQAGIEKPELLRLLLENALDRGRAKRRRQLST